MPRSRDQHCDSVQVHLAFSKGQRGQHYRVSRGAGQIGGFGMPLGRGTGTHWIRPRDGQPSGGLGVEWGGIPLRSTAMKTLSTLSALVLLALAGCADQQEDEPAQGGQRRLQGHARSPPTSSTGNAPQARERAAAEIRAGGPGDLALPHAQPPGEPGQQQHRGRAAARCDQADSLGSSAPRSRFRSPRAAPAGPGSSRIRASGESHVTSGASSNAADARRSASPRAVRSAPRSSRRRGPRAAPWHTVSADHRRGHPSQQAIGRHRLAQRQVVDEEDHRPRGRAGRGPPPKMSEASQ